VFRSGTYPWSFETHIFQRRQPNHGGTVQRYTDSDFSFCIFNFFLIKSRDLNIELLTISSANIWKLSGLELKHILIQQEFIFIEKYRTNIPKGQDNLI
jgi:hypothetical protein